MREQTILELGEDRQFQAAWASFNRYRTIAAGIGCRQFAFDWDVILTIGYLMTLPVQ